MFSISYGFPKTPLRVALSPPPPPLLWRSTPENVSDKRGVGLIWMLLGLDSDVKFVLQEINFLPTPTPTRHLKSVDKFIFCDSW